jgi:hypothetical protein
MSAENVSIFIEHVMFFFKTLLSLHSSIETGFYCMLFALDPLVGNVYFVL